MQTSTPSSSSHESFSLPPMLVSSQSMLHLSSFNFPHHDRELPTFVWSPSHTSSPSHFPPHSVTTIPSLSPVILSSSLDSISSPIDSLSLSNSSTNVSTSLLSSSTQTVSQHPMLTCLKASICKPKHIFSLTSQVVTSSTTDIPLEPMCFT
ncbi:hypothetical protein ACH5RR_036618 [Cinchona calisaya]|uniref:Uncharacterized protein n=1 Tax=Cinchona calisaya TaxID=153742 RepID=A0ABD2Y3R3_9GENT